MFDLLELLQVYRTRQYDLTCVKNPLLWQLKREQWPFVAKRKVNCLYKCINDFTIRHNTICQLMINIL